MKFDPDTKAICGQNILDEIKYKVAVYRQQQVSGDTKPTNPFGQLASMLKLQKEVIPKEDLIKSYMQDLKKELIKHLLPTDRTDISMASSSNEDVLAGESQDPDDNDDGIMEDDTIDEEKIDQMIKEIADKTRQALK
ncbi:hypothetical protein M9H77_13705 [Catharanthus roseus]|uniref:Uncharacterized protein n=1 Tax=Catharanthus roseus TaxID=4058 RepID=A0ACC0BL57_CATRO|nr:hypothetical protein M9H77_13705 [Catharanthus roseus]